MNYLFLVLAFILNATANILLKIGAKDGINLQVFPVFDFLKNNIYLILGFTFFVLNALFYFLALKNIPISLAYPVMVTMSLIIIGTYAAVAGHEQFTNYHFVGYAFIILGVVITFMNTK
jgi:multidrug transporter EmrE-like cation transporter